MFLDLPQNLIALAIGYLLGSIPFGLVLTKLAGMEDLRSIGSGNIGATNVLRTGHKGLAAGTLVLDALKGTIAVLIGAQLGEYQAIIAGLGAFLGHLYPVWLKFKGGKGVATFLGCALGLAWPGALVFAVVWLGVAAITRYSSVAALAASAATPLALWLMGRPEAVELFVALTALLWFKHWPNISRLMDGTETKIGQKP
ncbi:MULTISPECIES: glycerol-3-phosphate 1-O-acyltransferase PlsY [unclassified Beijerinckia]|uniref:glycerol-3-phosphate 1-O-acyltransferase PlsY n=1 Tax=unclassified Beijerinckia TaxID=2638183 RepID=UPI00089C67B9|nr:MULTISPECIES: glycerol-3-phosphate 1-O-acyltransferase PlsY [unclassified Beijerinckia]MDH7794544.1 glycerol-3-phosphate acyltransferase PlsY [Beijerinckia sp. GAS462]SEB66018.1 glycerol-3-phosphate acyltransferase PlsY [Beijerinckia sp. 28-YEA-48]